MNINHRNVFYGPLVVDSKVVKGGENLCTSKERKSDSCLSPSDMSQVILEI